MSFNSEAIVQTIRTEFESLLEYVQDSPARTADEVERHLFKQLLGLGAQLLLLFFSLRAAAYPRAPRVQDDGSELGYHSEKKRNYYSIFGKVLLWRPYFYAPGSGGASPLDAELSLGKSCYSDLVREVAEYLGVAVPYAKVSRFFAQLLGHGLSTEAIEGLITEDAREVERYYEQQPAPPVRREAALLVAQADGKGVPLVRQMPVAPQARLGKGQKRCQKKEAVVTTLYTIAPQPRTPEAVIASFFAHAPTPTAASHPRAAPQNKQVWATLAGKEAAFERLARQVAKRDGTHIEDRVALTDGCEALQQRMQHYLPAFTLVLDFVHASEYLWKAANALFGEQSAQRNPWVEEQALHLLSGRTDQVIADLQCLRDQPRRTPAQGKALSAAVTYFQRNRPYMAYDRYLARGWPIASGVIEGACRHLVKDRCELSGMHWTQEGAENLLRLRAVAENGDWDAYHHFRKQQRHLRLYGALLPQPVDPEQQALALPNADKIIRLDRIAQRRPSQQNLPQQRLTA